MRVLVINKQGGGFPDYLDIPDDITVAQLFNQQCPDKSPEDYLIRVNRQPAPRDQRLVAGDRISFTPTKIEGAAARSFGLNYV